METYDFKIPGHENLRFSLQPGDMTSGLKIFCDGKPMTQKWGKFKTTLASGEEIVLGLKYSIDIFNPKVTYKKHVIQVTPSVPTGQLVLTYAPLILVTMGGAIGGLFGALGAFANHSLFCSKLPKPLKVTFSILVTFAAFVCYAIGAAMANQALNGGQNPQ